MQVLTGYASLVLNMGDRTNVAYYVGTSAVPYLGAGPDFLAARYRLARRAARPNLTPNSSAAIEMANTTMQELKAANLLVPTIATLELYFLTIIQVFIL